VKWQEIMEEYPGVNGHPFLPHVDRATYYVNFLTRWKFTNLEVWKRCLNVHPAPPAYPGVGAPSRALLSGDQTFGVTVHRMMEGFDDGPIVWTLTFDVDRAWGVVQLHRAAELRALEALEYVLARLTEWHPTRFDELKDRRMVWLEFFDHGSVAKWGLYWSRKDLDAALTLDLSGTASDENVARHARAFAYPGKPGPWLQAGGRRWRLDL
jgi:methionyl-tRNA formyltransferase